MEHWLSRFAEIPGWVAPAMIVLLIAFCRYRVPTSVEAAARALGLRTEASLSGASASGSVDGVLVSFRIVDGGENDPSTVEYAVEAPVPRHWRAALVSRVSTGDSAFDSRITSSGEAFSLLAILDSDTRAWVSLLVRGLGSVTLDVTSPALRLTAVGRELTTEAYVNHVRLLTTIACRLRELAHEDVGHRLLARFREDPEPSTRANVFEAVLFGGVEETADALRAEAARSDSLRVRALAAIDGAEHGSEAPLHALVAEHGHAALATALLDGNWAPAARRRFDDAYACLRSRLSGAFSVAVDGGGELSVASPLAGAVSWEPSKKTT